MRRMSFRGGGGRVSTTPDEEPPVGSEDIVLQGYLKKLKTGKRKYFVLHSGRTEHNTLARLEYFDNEKKWKVGTEPKRSISIRSCFNINRRHDPKGRIVLALYTPKDCFALVCASLEEQELWLRAMLRLQHEGHYSSDQQPKPNFDHIWEVNIKPKSLGMQRHLQGEHRLCLTARTLTLVHMEKEKSSSNHSLPGPDDGRDDGPSILEFPLNSIRRCGHTDCFFFMELGRSSVTGAGELWMQTDDTVIAQNMHEVILSAMKSSKNIDDLPRNRSNSTSDNSNPVAIPRKMAASMAASSTGLGGASPHSGQMSGMMHPGASPRERCDSLPARSRQSSESFDHAVPTRCNTMDCSQVGQPHSYHWSPSGGVSPLSQLHNHSSLESCAEESSPHMQQSAQRNHLHINVTHPLDSQTITEELESNSDYLAMSSPTGNIDGSGSLIPSPVTLTDGGPTSFSSHGGNFPGYLPHQQSCSSSSNEYMKMSPTHEGCSSQQNNNYNNNINNNNNTDSSYMSMSPVGSSGASINLFNGGSGTLPNGYVPMMAVSSATSIGLHKTSNSESSPMSPPGYMEMAPLSSSLPKSVGGFSGSWGSSIHSLHENSPTCDLNMEGFHLEKVKSFIAPSNDDSNSIRTGRSYSVGKRPTERFSSSSSSSNNERVRAYSVGSQSYPAALAAKKRQQQQLHQDILATPTSDRGRSNSYSKKSSSTTTLGGGSRHSEEFMEINYDENWHRATSAAAAAATNSPLTLPSSGNTSLNNNNNTTNNNNNNDSDYLPMMRVNYKDSDSSMKLFPVKEIDVSPPMKEAEKRKEPAKSNRSNPDYMDLTCGPMSPPQSVPQMQTSRTTETEGDYVSLDMSRPFQVRSSSSNPVTGGPEAKKCKSEVPSTSFSSNDVPMMMMMTTTQHNYENLSFGASGATTTTSIGASIQEPMETDNNTSSRVSSSMFPPPIVAATTTVVPNGTNCHELNYAALDLPPTCDDAPLPQPNRPLPVGCTSTMDLTTPTPTSGVAYSEVDFRKSEGLRGSLLREGGRV